MSKSFLIVLILVSTTVWAGPRSKLKAPGAVTATTTVPVRPKPAVPTATRGLAVCTPGEKWELAPELVSSVPALSLTEFTATARDRVTPFRGFSEALLLQSDKNEIARSLGAYWMGRSLFLADMYGPAIAQFNDLVAERPTSGSLPFQIAAMECLRSIHAKFPVPLLTNESMANLPNYFKPGLTPSSQAPILDMTVEVVSRRIAEKAPAETVESALKLLKDYRYYGDYARGIWDSSRKLGGELSSLKRFVDAKDLPAPLEAHRNEVRVLLARVLYQDKKYAEASRVLEGIDKRSNAFVQALILQSWMDLGRNEHRRVVGTTIAFQSTGLKWTFAPDAYMTGVMALNEFCLFPEALRVLNNFRRSYAPSYDWLRTKSKVAKELYPKAIAYLTKQQSDVPPQIASEWIRSPIFLSNQRAINGSFQQEKATGGAIKNAKAFEATEAARLEALRRKVAIREANEIAKEAAKKFSAADAITKDLTKKFNASVKAVDMAMRDAAKAAATAKLEAKRASEAPAMSEKIAGEARVIAQQAVDAKATLATAELIEANAKAELAAAEKYQKVAYDKAAAADKMAGTLALRAKEAENRRFTAFAPFHREETKAKKAEAEAEVVGAKADKAKRELEAVESEYAVAKKGAVSARAEAKSAAQVLRNASKKSEDAKSKAAYAAWEKTWEKARAEKSLAEARARRVSQEREALEKRLQESKAARPAVSFTQPGGNGPLLVPETAPMDFGASGALQLTLRVIADTKAVARAAEKHAALESEVSSAQRKVAEAESKARDSTAAIEDMKRNAVDERSARKISQTAEAAAKKTAAAAKAAEGKLGARRQTNDKLQREYSKLAATAASARKDFEEASVSLRPFETRAAESLSEANSAKEMSRRLRAEAQASKEKAKQLESSQKSASKVVSVRRDEHKKLSVKSVNANKLAEEAKANIAISTRTAKAAAQKAVDAKGNIQVAVAASEKAKKEASDVKEKSTLAAQVAKECARFAAAVQREGGKAGEVERPKVAVLETPSTELLRLNELLQGTQLRQTQLKKSLGVWTQTLTRYKEGAPRHRERLMAHIETVFKALNQRMLKQLEAVAKNNDLVEAEIWQGAGKDLVWQNANPEYATAIKEGKFQSRTPASDGSYDWGTTTLSQNGKREVWEDEVGNASANLVDNCSNKERYASLRKK